MVIFEALDLAGFVTTGSNILRSPRHMIRLITFLSIDGW
jgi:hypothetical protein